MVGVRQYYLRKCILGDLEGGLLGCQPVHSFLEPGSLRRHLLGHIGIDVDGMDPGAQGGSRRRHLSHLQDGAGVVVAVVIVVVVVLRGFDRHQIRLSDSRQEAFGTRGLA